MKKLVLVALVAATSAFAWTDGKSMVELNECLGEGRCESLDLRIFNNDLDNEAEEQSIALNYNWLFTNNFGAGLLYSKNESTVNGDVTATTQDDNNDTVQVNLFWNFDGGWESSFVAVRYGMTNVEEVEGADNGSEATNVTLEYGKRMEMGKVFGLSLLYSPSISYTMGDVDFDDDSAEDVKTTEARLNVANFAVKF